MKTCWQEIGNKACKKVENYIAISSRMCWDFSLDFQFSSLFYSTETKKRADFVLKSWSFLSFIFHFEEDFLMLRKIHKEEEENVILKVMWRCISNSIKLIDVSFAACAYRLKSIQWHCALNLIKFKTHQLRGKSLMSNWHWF